MRFTARPGTQTNRRTSAARPADPSTRLPRHRTRVVAFAAASLLLALPRGCADPGPASLSSPESLSATVTVTAGGLTVSGTNPTTMILSWLPIRGIRSYDVAYTINGVSGVVLKRGITATTLTVTGLPASSTVQVRYRAVYKTKTGGWSPIAKLTLPQPAPTTTTAPPTTAPPATAAPTTAPPATAAPTTAAPTTAAPTTAAPTTAAPTTVPRTTLPATTAPATTAPATTAAPTTVPRTTVPATTAPATTAPATTAAPTTTSTTVPGGAPSFIPSNFDTSQYINYGGGIPASSANEPTGSFRLMCEFSHLAYDDPIVYPGQPGMSHLHMFFGNTGANASSTYNSLRTGGSSTCQGGPINRSAYWAPALFNASNKVVTPDFITVYYKGPGHDVNGNITDVRTLPAGLKMIAGYDMASPQSWNNFEWNCELTQRKQTTIPSCPTGEKVGVLLAFPTCWDGKNLDSTNHRSHMSYGVRNPDTGRMGCPTTHPVSLPEFTLGIWFTNDGNSQNWYLSSDRMAGMVHANGSTFHSDWFGAWDPVVQNTWTDECINGLLNCSGGSLGDGSQLKGAANYSGPATLTAPPVPS